jgi:hypothetical protein
VSTAVAPDGTARPTIGSQWVKANAIGAAINVAVTFVAFLIGQALGVNEKDASAALQTVFVLFATVALGFGLLVMGYLSGVVLRTKLPAFPMRTWLALYVVFGAVFGSVSAFAWLTPEIPTDPGPVETAIVLGLMLGAAIAGVVISTVVGSLQALIIRPAAVGLGRWIACCALAGLLFMLIVPAVLYGPQSGFAQELVVELVTLVVTILAAVVLLPAVERLQPR